MGRTDILDMGRMDVSGGENRAAESPGVLRIGVFNLGRSRRRGRVTTTMKPGTRSAYNVPGTTVIAH